MHCSRSGSVVPDANPTFVFEMLLIGQTGSEKILASIPLVERGTEIRSGVRTNKSMSPVSIYFKETKLMALVQETTLDWKCFG